MEQTKSVPLSSKYALDVTTLFKDTVAHYHHFTNNIHGIISDLPTYTPNEISYECKCLADTKKTLKAYDQQIIEVLEATGADIIKDNIIQDYRLALADASLASNDLFQHLQELKIDLQIASLQELM